MALGPEAGSAVEVVVAVFSSLVLVEREAWLLLPLLLPLVGEAGVVAYTRRALIVSFFSLDILFTVEFILGMPFKSVTSMGIASAGIFGLLDLLFGLMSLMLTRSGMLGFKILRGTDLTVGRRNLGFSDNLLDLVEGGNVVVIEISSSKSIKFLKSVGSCVVSSVAVGSSNRRLMILSFTDFLGWLGAKLILSVVANILYCTVVPYLVFLVAGRRLLGRSSLSSSLSATLSLNDLFVDGNLLLGFSSYPSLSRDSSS